ncbi:MAG: winged helix-turn-helix domain-containing protein [Planctomycetaceae bacterium]|nr:winged helix-turn-helix domain-containing protein [Planctomycetaceae bacterium]
MKRTSILRPCRDDYVTEQQRRLKAAKLFRQCCSQADEGRSEDGESLARHLEGRGKGCAGRDRANGSQGEIVGKRSVSSGGDPAGGCSDSRFRDRLVDAQANRQVIRREFGVKFHVGHVWKVLSQMGWSCRRPKRKSRERNEVGIKSWVRYSWP